MSNRSAVGSVVASLFIVCLSCAMAGCGEDPAPPGGGDEETGVADAGDVSSGDAVDDGGGRDATDAGGDSGADTSVDTGGSGGDTGGEGGDTSDTSGGTTCNYKNTAEGVCAGSTLDDQGNCRQPDAYESDESRCDGKDNDCDGTVDEGCPCAYKGIGKGVCGDATISADSGDCGEPDAYESEESTCDGKDNDCDGEIDESGSQQTFYRDKDGDGYGVSSTTTKACSNPDPDKWADQKNDCNDDNADVYPGAPEICDGQANNNCNAQDNDQDDPKADSWCQQNHGGGVAGNVQCTERQGDVCCRQSAGGPVGNCLN